MGKLVGTSDDRYATWKSPQRKSFYVSGRFWVFYSDGTDMVYKTSTDGVNWVGPTTIRACNSGSKFSIWFDGTYLYYAYSSGGANTPLYYRSGTPNSDGLITWSNGEEQAVANAVNVQYLSPVVSVDSDGYAWIGYWQMEGLTHYPFVTMSVNNDGTWGATPGGFPYQLSDSSSPCLVSVVPLTGGETLAIYYRPGKKINARLWNGAIPWGDEISTINVSSTSSTYFSAVAEGDDVHLVFVNSSLRLIYAKYDYSSNSFTAEKMLLTGITIIAPPVISIDENNDLHVFWGGFPESHSVYYMIYTAENDTWGPAVKWKSVPYILNYYSLTCFYKQYNGYTGLAYVHVTSSLSYEVMFNYVAPPPPPGSTPAPGEPGSPGAPEPTPEPEVVSDTLTSGGSRHTTPEEGSVGMSLSVKRTRISRHITWVPVIITRA